MLTTQLILRLFEQGEFAQLCDLWGSTGSKQRKVGHPPYDLHLIGIAFAYCGNSKQSASLLRKSCVDSDFHPEIVGNASVILHQSGLSDLAERFLRSALVRSPDDPQLHNNLGSILIDTYNYEDASRHIYSALRQDGQNPLYLKNLAKCLISSNQHQKLIDYARAHDSEAAVNALASYLILAHTALGDVDSALEHYAQLPDSARNSQVQAAISQALLTRGALPDAYRHANLAYSLDPSSNDVKNQLGVILFALGRHREAENFLLASAQSGDSRFLLDYAAFQIDSERFEEASTILSRVNSTPHTAFLLNKCLGMVAKRHLKNLSEALEYFQRASDLSPGNLELCGEVYELSNRVLDFSSADAAADRISTGFVNGLVVPSPFYSLHWTSDPSLQLTYAESFGKYLAKPSCDDLFSLESCRDNRRIKIGYFSSDLRAHAVGYLISEMLEHHDSERFEIIAFTYGPQDSSDLSRRLRNSFDEWYRLDSLEPGTDTVDWIRSHHLDIGIDLNGYTTHGKPWIFASRIAPIQVNFLGYPGTMGCKNYDYIVADDFIIPAGHDSYYSENVLRLPVCYQPSDSTRSKVVSSQRSLYNLPEDKFVFGAFNNASKLKREVLELWAEVLNDCEDSVLWVLDDSANFRHRLRKFFLTRGVSASRILFAPKVPIDNHLERHGVVDLMLDSFPYGAHTTANDCMWTGTPLLTLCGESFASRVSSSIINASGLSELICYSPDEYRKKASFFYQNSHSLLKLREHLLSTRSSSPLFDMRRFARDFESSLLSVMH